MPRRLEFMEIPLHKPSKIPSQYSFGKKLSYLYKGLKETNITCHIGLSENKSIMLHEIRRKTKVSCYMSSREKQKYHVTWAREKNKSIVLHGLREKQKYHVT